MIKENQKYIKFISILADVFAIIISFVFSYFIRFESGLFKFDAWRLTLNQYFLPIIFAIPVYIYMYNVFNLYKAYRLKSFVDESINIAKAGFLVLLILVLVLYLFKEINYSRYFLFIFTLSVIFFTAIQRTFVRLILRYIRRSGYNQKHILIIGNNNFTIELINRFQNNKHWGYNIIGILDSNDNSGDLFIGKESVTVLGNLNCLEGCLKKYSVDEVYCTLSPEDFEQIDSVIFKCENAGVRVSIVPHYHEYVSSRTCIEEIDGLPVINLRYIPLDNILNKTIKRVLDVAISIISVVLLSPLIIIIAVIIKLTSKGPIIFRQERIGYNNKSFTMYKFRTMHVQNSEEEKDKWSAQNDTRKTKFGSLLRKTSLDELPQLFNVIRGDMSIVGPRPERPHFVNTFSKEIPKYMVKHQVKPGITGWAQVNGFRGDTSIQKRIEHDIYYIENWSLLLDIKILWITMFSGLVNKNAY